MERLGQDGTTQQTFQRVRPEVFQLVDATVNEDLFAVSNYYSRFECNANCHRFDIFLPSGRQNLFRVSRREQHP